jgi:hypothetical protein
VTLFIVAGALVKTVVHNPLPVGVPLLGRDANDVYQDIKDAGLPVADGTPKSSEYRDIVNNNSCKSSRSFVRTDTDVGWAIICVKPPAAAYKRMSATFDEGVPALAGPLYVDDGDGDVVIFGLGWPDNASKQLYDAIDASGGSYLTKSP